jgi:hypothetical protein
MFEIGEVINPEDWGLRVQVSSLDPLEVVVVKNTEPNSHVGKFFFVGRTLRLVRVAAEVAIWRIDANERDMPWYVLGIHEGRKRFEHYR